MTVQELINKLTQEDPEAVVYARGIMVYARGIVGALDYGDFDIDEPLLDVEAQDLSGDHFVNLLF